MKIHSKYAERNSQKLTRTENSTVHLKFPLSTVFYCNVAYLIYFFLQIVCPDLHSTVT